MCGRFSQAYSWNEIVAFSQPLTVPAATPKRVNKAGEGDDDLTTIEPFKDDLF